MQNAEWLIDWAKNNKTTNAYFTKFGQREVKKMTYNEICDVFGQEAATFNKMLKSGEIINSRN